MHKHKAFIVFSLLLANCAFSFSISGQTYNIHIFNGQTVSGCTGDFTDFGDISSDYGNNESDTITFCAPSGQVFVNFSSFSVRAGDTLSIYDGANTSAALLGKYSGLGLTFTVFATGSCLTFVFNSDASLTEAGWAASIHCCPDPSVGFTGLQAFYDIQLDGPVTLTPNPAGGVFSGPGISGSVFTPSIAGVGIHTVRYVYTDTYGCSTTITQTTDVRTYNNRAGARLVTNIHDWCSSNAAYSNTTATGDGAAGSCWSGGTDHNVWFRFFATTTSVKADIITGGVYGTMRGQQIAIWNSAGVQQACNNAGWNYSGTLSLSLDNLVVGQEYFISVDDQTTHGTFSLCIDDEPGFDLRSGAILINNIDSWCSASAGYSNSLMTPDQSAGSCWSGGTGNNVWFKFIPPGNAIKVSLATGTTYGTMRGQQIAIWNSQGVQVACNDAGWNFSGTSSLSADTLKAGSTYYISIDDQTTHGSFTLCTDDDPGYDFRSGAYILTSTTAYCSADAVFSNSFSTGDGSAGSCWSGGTDHNVWFRFTADTKAINVLLKTGGSQGTMRGQQAAIWNSSGILVACNDAGWNYSGTLTLGTDTLTVGHTYYISIDDQTTHGTFTLCADNKADYDFKSGAMPMYITDDWCSTDAQFSNQFATRDGNAGSCWSGGTDHNVWFEFVAETGGIKVDILTGGTYGTMRGQQIAIWNSSGVQLACNDGGWNYSGTLSLSIDTLTAGRHYFISIDDQTTHGTFSMCLDNKVGFDFREDAFILSDLDHWCSSDALYSNRYATADGSAGSCWSGGTDHNVWFKFIAVSGQIQIDVKTGGTYGTMRGQQLAIWNQHGTQVACIDAGWNFSGTLSLLTDTLTSGRLYYVSVDDQTTHGTFTICANNKSGYDFKSGAVPLSGLADWCSSDAQFDNRFATRDESGGSCWSGGTDHNVWFHFTASTNAVLVEIKTGGTFGTMRGQQVAIWNAAGVQVACNDAGWNFSGVLTLASDTLTAGHEYYIAVDDQTTHGTFTLCLDNQPGYDFRSDALLLNSTLNWCSTDALYDNRFATADHAAGSCWSGGTDHNVWFQFVSASNSAEILVKTGGTFGTMRGQQVALWNSAGIQVACMDGGWNYSGTLTLSADTLTVGRTYYISVDDQTTHGTFSLCVSCLPGYDFKEGALLLNDIDNWCGPDAVYSNRFATPDESAGSCWAGGTDHNVWFKFSAVSGQAEVIVRTGGTYGTMRGQQIAIWNASGTQLACIDAGWNYSGDLVLSVDTLTAGRIYYISVDDQTTHGTFSLCVNNKTGYDFRSGAVALTNLDNWCSAQGLYSNQYATTDETAGSCWTGGTDHNVWFSFTALFDTAVISVTTGGAFGTMRGQQIAVWTTAGVQIGCVNTGWNYSGVSSLTLNSLVQGNTYYISVDDRTTHGTFSLCIDNVSGLEYWAIASGNWNVPANWSRTEGGPPAISKPQASHVVHIKGYNISVTGSEACARLDMPVANNNTSLTVDGGTLTVNGNLTSANNGTNYTGNISAVNGGAIHINRDLQLTRNGGNSAINLSLSGASSMTVGQDFTFSSSAGTTATNSVTLSNSAILNVTRDLTLSNSGGPKTTFILNNSAVFNASHDIVLSASAQNRVEIQANNNSILNLYGNFRRGVPAYGILASNDNATLVFHGISYLQTWPANAGSGTDGFSYKNVVINNSKVTSPQVTLEGQVTVTGSVIFTDGIVAATATNILIIPAGASVSGASNDSYVDGPVRKTGNTSFTFPVGSAGIYKALTISAPAVVTDAYTCRYYYANSHPTYDHNLKESSLKNISECEYWLLTRDAGTSSVQATPGWGSLSCCIGSLSNLRVAVWEGASWINHGNGGTTGTQAGGTIITSVALSQSNNVISFANTLPEVSFSGLSATYCESAASALLSGSPAGAGGVFTGRGITDNGDGTATFQPSLTGAGTFSIVFTYTDPVTGCSDNTTQSVTVHGNPEASMYQSATVCSGSLADLNIFFTGRAPWNYSYNDGTNTFSGSTSANPYTFQSSVPGTYRVTALSDANGCIGSDFGSTAIISNYPSGSVPVIDTIGPVSFCEGSSVTLFTAPAGAFAFWSNGISGYSQVITEPGSYWVKIVDNNGCVSPQSLPTTITVNKVPRKPFSITGNTSICQNGPASALNTVSAYATTYNWNVAPVAAGTFSGSGSSVTLTWDPLFSGVATITVSGSNALCGEGPVSDPLVITVHALPSDPGSISGQTAICRSSQDLAYSITPVADATSYVWTLPSGAIIDGPSTGSSINVDFNGSAASGNITVRPANGCGSSFNSSSLAVALYNRPVPSLSGNTSVTINDIVVYRTDPGMSNYAWSVSAGGQVMAGGGTASDSVVVRWTSSGSQWVSVNYTNSNNCSALTSQNLPVTVSLLPGKPATPTGSTLMCNGSPDTPYTTTGATGAVSYVWSLAPAAAGSVSGSGTTGTVTWNATWFGTATITVSGHNAGGDGPASDALSIDIYKKPDTDSIFYVPNLN